MKTFSYTLASPWFEIAIGLGWLIGWLLFCSFKITRSYRVS